MYCRYHKDVGHNTEYCIQLKNEIEYFIGQGKLNKYTKDGNNNNRDNWDNQDKRDVHDKRPQPRGPMVNIIYGSTTTAETSRKTRKAYAREFLQVVGGPPKKAKKGIAIVFDDDDLEGIKFSHDNPLVIIPVISNSSVKRVLVDGSTSVEHPVSLRILEDGVQ